MNIIILGAGHNALILQAYLGRAGLKTLAVERAAVVGGGLSTLEEKALGAMAKAGSRPLCGVLKYGEAPKRTGLHFMDAPAPAVEMSLGSSLIASGVLRKPVTAANDPLAPIRRMSKAEKIAFFS